MTEDYPILLTDPNHCAQVAYRLSFFLHPLITLSFVGDLGAGKTTFIRGILQGMGIAQQVKSPTYSIVESYCVQDIIIHHFDLYRITDNTELDYLGFRDYFTAEAICLIEWPQKAQGFLTNVDIEFNFKILEPEERLLTIKCHSAKGKKIGQLAGYYSAIY